jgi:tetratricopeptide (TPR) repeat protein
MSAVSLYKKIIRLSSLLFFIVGMVFPRIVFAIEPSKENFFQLATLAARDGAYEQAIEFLKKAIELAPKFVPAYNTLGIVYETSEKSNLEEAIRYFKLATEISPESVESWNNLGRAYYTQGDFNHSEKTLLKALSLQPDQPEVEITLGWVYLLGQSRASEAIDHFEKGLSRIDNVMAHYGVGLADLIENERFKVLDEITKLRKGQRDDLATKLEQMLNQKVRLTSEPGMPLVTGTDDGRSIFAEQLQAIGGAESVTADKNLSGIQVRLKGPLKH